MSDVSGMTVLSIPVTIGYLRKVGERGEKYPFFILYREIISISTALFSCRYNANMKAIKNVQFNAG